MRVKLCADLDRYWDLYLAVVAHGAALAYLALALHSDWWVPSFAGWFLMGRWHGRTRVAGRGHG